MGRIRVSGENNKHNVILYTLSTCVWCKKTKHFLNVNKIEYEYLDVDTASPDERKEAVTIFEKHRLSSKGESIAFPIIIIDHHKIIMGFKEEEIKKTLGI